MSSQRSILEGLYSSRNTVVNEEVTQQAKLAVKKFLGEHKATSDEKKKINNILNYIYTECNKLGENIFRGGILDYTKGSFNEGDAESGPILDVFPSLYELKMEIKFQNRQTNINSTYETLVTNIKKDMKKNYKKFHDDYFSAIITINVPEKSNNSANFGFYIVIEKSGGQSLNIILYKEVNPLYESNKPEPTQQIRYFKGSKPQDKFTFKFTLYNSKDKGECVKISVENTYWDKHNYAFIPLKDLDLSKIYSYGDDATEMVKSALEKAGYKVRDFEKIVSQLKSDNESPGLGTEIGLPIDRENCENTTIAGIATPNGVVGEIRKRKNILIESPIEEDEEKDDSIESDEEVDAEETILCPKCKSKNVNVFGTNRFHCSDCDYEWVDTDNDGENDDKLTKDTMLNNSEDEKPLKVYTSNNNDDVNIY